MVRGYCIAKCTTFSACGELLIALVAIFFFFFFAIQIIYVNSNPVFNCYYITMRRLLLNWEKQEIQLCYDTYSQTNQHSAIPIFKILMNISEQSFPYQIFKIFSNICWVWLLLLCHYLFCKQMTFHFTSQMILSHLLPMSMNKKLLCKGHGIYSKILRKIC